VTIPTITVSPIGAARAYAQVAGSGDASNGGFAETLGRALQGIVSAGREADAQALQAITGGGNLTEVATAVSRAELALQSAVAIRDKVVQAYQDIMRMPI
jgi:flagellar hook-basal body complex protein FliE